MSPPSICQPGPSVAANPNPIALRRGDCASSDVDKAPHATNIVAMDRRTFILLSGAASAAVWDPYRLPAQPMPRMAGDRKSTRLNSSHLVISYAVFCLKQKN